MEKLWLDKLHSYRFFKNQNSTERDVGIGVHLKEVLIGHFQVILYHSFKTSPCSKLCEYEFDLHRNSARRGHIIFI